MLIAAIVVGVAVAAAIGYRLGTARVGATVVRASIPQQHDPQPEGGAGSHADGLSRQDIERALADLRLGVVVVTAKGEVDYRNNQALRYATGRHGDALVEAALQRVIDGALVGLSLEESVEVYGPPARSLLVQASPTFDRGSISGAVGVIDDVSEVRHIDRVRSDFVANVSHELRTPVGAISVLAETIAEAEEPEVIARLADRMQREASRLGATIDDLLALSRLESGPVAEPETIDLVSVATMAIERTTEAAQQQGVTIELESQGGRSVLIDGDPGQLVAAVANLIDNAVKYSDSGQTVTVEVGVETDGGAADDSETGGNEPGETTSQSAVAELTVVDAGIGIPERDLDRIFERFYRVDSARRRGTGGTGLGLSIVRHALINHGGTIRVASTEGQGSTFTIQLPLSAAHQRIAGEHPARYGPVEET
ncbi:MAG: ATP-binding protein [Acidimicrobiales bacterium]